MKVLVCGASGFIGRHVVNALHEAGHEVVKGVSRSAPTKADDEVVVDFARDIDPAVWRGRLGGVQAVVNAVGVLRDSRRRPMRRVHADVPRALFAACAAEGVRRVVQVSALGIAQSDTAYARTKLAAEEALLQLTASGRLDGVVLRPSVVYGPGGASSALFDALARLPLLLVPRPVVQARVQPIRVQDLAEVVARLVDDQACTGVLDCAGPPAFALGEFIDGLRARRGYRPAARLVLPDVVTRASAWLGDLLPVSPWGRQALALLMVDNTASAQACTRVLGRPPGDPLGEPQGGGKPSQAVWEVSPDTKR
jgi:uncharacterized protein YbjT (DUF2867 family)